MPRPEAWRLDAAAYPYTDTIQTRFADLDVLGHINNVAMAALFETGRTRFNEAAGLTQWRKPRWLVAAQEINYLAEGSYPADVVVTHGVGRIGGRSWTLLGGAFQSGRAIATCDVTVVIDAPELPDSFREALSRWTFSR